MPAAKTPPIVNTRSCGSGGASALAIGTSKVTASPDRHAELVGERIAHDQPVATVAQRCERARNQQRLDVGDRRLALRIDAAQRHRHHVLPCIASACRSMYGATATTPGSARTRAASAASSTSLRRALIDDARVRRQRQQAIAQFTLEAIHDREHHDQRPDAQRHTGQRHPGDERHEEGVLARAHVAQADEQ